MASDEQNEFLQDWLKLLWHRLKHHCVLCLHSSGSSIQKPGSAAIPSQHVLTMMSYTLARLRHERLR